MLLFSLITIVIFSSFSTYTWISISPIVAAILKLIVDWVLTAYALVEFEDKFEEVLEYLLSRDKIFCWFSESADDFGLFVYWIL